MPSIATIGFFDGVHKGHQYLFEQLHSYAQRYDERVLIFTFLQHPRTVLSQLASACDGMRDTFCPLLLTTLNERERLLCHYGDVHFFDFTQVQPLTAAQFLDYLADRWKVKHLLMGYNHHFGSDGLLSENQYAAIEETTGVRILRAQPYIEGEHRPSSTAIRNSLLRGDIQMANNLLGYQYSVSGRVVHGRMIGRTIGFPTANIMPDALKLIPAAGVYKVRVSVATDDTFCPNSNANESRLAIVNIGNNPTIGNIHQTIEVHIPGFEGDLYNRILTIQFIERLRSEKRFESLDALRMQIQQDIASL